MVITFLNTEVKGDDLGNLKDHEIARRLSSGEDFTESLIDSSRSKAMIDKFAAAGIAYDFMLDMTETNNLDATLNFLDVLTKSMGSIGVSGGIDRSRENIETFTLTDTFRELLEIPKDEKDRYCELYVATKNMTYPITGTIGVRRALNTFIGLTLFSRLSSKNDKGIQGPPTYTASLTFTTSLSGTIAPKITFAPFRGAGVADISANSVNSRKDVHHLVIGMAMPDEPAAVAKDEKAEAGKVSARTNFVAVGRGGPVQQLAVDAVNRSYIREGLTRPSNIVPLP